MAENLGTLLTETCGSFAGRPALEQAGVMLSYDQLSASAELVAHALRDYGLRPDEPVLVPVANEARNLAAFMGVWQAGGVVVPIARHAPAVVTEATRAATSARFLVTASDEVVRPTGHTAAQHRPMLAGAAIIVFTSGSTGHPKGWY